MNEYTIRNDDNGTFITCGNCRLHKHVGFDYVRDASGKFERVWTCAGGKEIHELQPRPATRECFKPDRDHLWDVSPPKTCTNCGVMLWYATNKKRGYGVNWHTKGCCSPRCVAELKVKTKARRRNPLGIDMTIDTTPGRSTCAVMQCDNINRNRNEILGRLDLDDDAKARITTRTDEIRKAYLKAIKCMPNHGRHITAAALVYVASKELGITITQGALQEVTGVCTATVRTLCNEIIAATRRVVPP